MQTTNKSLTTFINEVVANETQKVLGNQNFQPRNFVQGGFQRPSFGSQRFPQSNQLQNSFQRVFNNQPRFQGGFRPPFRPVGFGQQRPSFDRPFNRFSGPRLPVQQYVFPNRPEFCFYHQKFGGKAYRCDKPCVYFDQYPNSNFNNANHPSKSQVN
jgi:hypothetical protein